MPTARQKKDGNGPAAHERRWAKLRLEATGPAPVSRLPVGGAAGACRRADALCDSNPARTEEPSRRRVGAAAHLPGAASRWRGPAFNTDRAADRDGNCEYWRHRPRAGSHRPPGVAPGHEAIDLLDTGASHRTGEENLVPRSDPFSRKWLWRVDHTQWREPMRRQLPR